MTPTRRHIQYTFLPSEGCGLDQPHEILTTSMHFASNIISGSYSKLILDLLKFSTLGYVLRGVLLVDIRHNLSLIFQGLKVVATCTIRSYHIPLILRPSSFEAQGLCDIMVGYALID